MATDISSNRYISAKMINNSGGQNILSEEEANNLINRLMQKSNIDSPKERATRDLWGNPFIIAFEKLTNQSVMVVIYSRGKDGKLYSHDDLIVSNKFEFPVN